MAESPAQILRRHGLRAKYSWGQNFLGDEQALERIASAAALKPREPVVEIGPGLGHLTRFLLATGAEVTAIERDRDMARVLRKEITDERLRILEANAVQVDFAEAAGADRVAVVGNLPYHLTSPILFRLLEQRSRISRAVLTVQNEVADRLTAEPGSRAYGLLTVILALYFEVRALFDLPAALFHPPPKVDSAVVRLWTRERPLVEIDSELRFVRVVKAGFAQRRKTLLNSLKSDRSLAEPAEVEAALQRAGIDGVRRAETLHVTEFAALERALAAGARGDPPLAS
ncbi:MAG TPA: 16S rRNA (adenine(1518)-N(6)/adenine(1519)-N(6))-dimethyltransferase RsmA [Myxococcaceae bacterium]|nr:16S rRNA (adenine(1518)-N(6)/adenine(1519)-N(6))-dimethyltransferase RsmA [Myxococcaceae bacterium]